MIKLKSLTITNIGRFVGSHTIDFESKSNFIQVDARNENTGGSSGAGKSTIFNALEYLLGCNDIPLTVLQSRLTKETMEVSAVLAKDHQEILVTRSKKGLSVQIDGTVFDGNVKLAEEKLQEVLGVKVDFLRKMIHKRQNEGGFFLQMKPQEAYDFLSDILNVGTWSHKLERIDDKIRALDQQTPVKEAEIKTLSDSLGSLDVTIEALDAPVKNFEDGLIPYNELALAEYQTELEGHNTNIDLITKGNEKDKKEALSKVEHPKKPEQLPRIQIESKKQELALLLADFKVKQEENQELVRALDVEIATISKTIHTAEIDARSVPKLRQDFDKIKSQILTIRSSTCPTCAQSWVTSSKEQTLQDLSAQIKIVKTKIDECVASSELLPIHQTTLSSLVSKKSDTQNQNIDSTPIELIRKEIDALENDWRAESEKLNTSYQEDLRAYHATITELNVLFHNLLLAKQKDPLDKITKVSAEIDRVKSTIQMIKNKESQYQSLLQQYNKTKDSLTASKELQQTKLSKAKSDLELLSSQSLIAKDASKILKSFIGQLFQDALGDIAFRSSEILKRIPNMSTASIQFESFKETKSGTIKAEINAVLSVDGEIGVPIKSLSGGERAAVDLAVDLAVIDVLEEVTGSGLDLMVLDEPFNGLDSTGKEECLTILSQHYTNRRIVIVEHSELTKEMVTDRIVVVRTGQESRIE